ncbi:MAG: hypothetical protein RLZZ30_1981 [Bacteroidota bacterium]|jgi:hypothetical protein
MKKIIKIIIPVILGFGLFLTVGFRLLDVIYIFGMFGTFVLLLGQFLSKRKVAKKMNRP